MQQCPQDTAKVLLGTLIGAIPGLPQLAALAFLLRSNVAHEVDDPLRRKWPIAALGAIVPTMLFFPLADIFAVFVAAGVVTGALWVFMKLLRLLRKPQRTARSEPQATPRSELRGAVFRRFVLAFAVVLIVGLAVSPDPWLPREDLTAGGETVSGYLLSSDPKRVVILEDDPRGIVEMRLTDEQTLERMYCVDPDYNSLPLIPDSIEANFAKSPLALMFARNSIKQPDCK